MGGVDDNGNEKEYTFNEYLEKIRLMGCYGCQDDNTGIHIWIGKEATMEDIINLIAHERAHFEYQPDDDPENIQDEIHCEITGQCARYAYHQAQIIMEKREIFDDFFNYED